MLDIEQPWFLPQLCLLVGGTFMMVAAANAWGVWFPKA